MHMCTRTHTHTHKKCMFNLLKDNEFTNARMVLVQRIEKKTHFILGKKKILMTLK